MRLWRFSATGFALWAVFAGPLFAAGYHYQVDVTSQLVEDSAGNLSSLKSSWLYDRSVSFFLMDDEFFRQAKRAQNMTRLAERIMSDLQEYSYYANLHIDGVNQQFTTVTEYKLELNQDKRLKLDFTLPLAQPVALAGKQIELKWLDPTGTGVLRYQSDDDVSMGSVKANCSIELENYPDARHGEVTQAVRFQCQ